MGKIVVRIDAAATQFWRFAVSTFRRLVAKIVVDAESGPERKPGLLAGHVTIKPGFDEVPSDFSDAFDR
jgi:hypothetical protein